MKCKGESSEVYKTFPMFYEYQDEFNGILVLILYCTILSSKPTNQGRSSYSKSADYGYLLVLGSMGKNASKPLLLKHELII